MTTRRIPAFSKELVEWLEATFRDRCPTVEMTDREVWIAAGSAQVVRKVRVEYERQFNNLET